MAAMTMYQPEIETMDSEAKHTLQSERLVALLARLSTVDNSYWADKLGDIDVDEIRSISDVTALPFTVKAELRQTYPYGMFARPLGDIVRLHASSGTSGKPTVVGYTRNDVALFAEVNARSLAVAGVASEDVLHNAYGYGLFTGGLGLHYGGEQLGCTVVPASGGNTSFQLQLMEDLGARALCATPSFAMLLAERARATGQLERLGVEVAILGAEPWSEGFRSKLEAAWDGRIDAVDIYGLSEVIGPGVAMESPTAKGALHIFDDHFFPEVVDPVTGEPVPDGIQGELVITTLTKEALPVIRYRTGDITSFVDGPSPDGRTFRRIARLSGRTDDMLIVRGVNVFPSEIEAVLLDDPAVGGQYAIIVDKRSALAEVTVRTELTEDAKDVDLGDVRRRLETDLAERLRVRMTAEVLPHGDMPRQEVGKAQRVFERTGDADPTA